MAAAWQASPSTSCGSSPRRARRLRWRGSRGPACEDSRSSYTAARVGSRRRVNVDTLNVELGTRSYPILIDAGLIGRAEVFRQHLPARDVLVLSNTTVAPLYLPALAASLGGRRIVEVILPDGEAHKTLASAARVLDVLVANRFGRDCAVLALGGGVVGDLAGLAAACFQRGVAFG